MMKGWGLSNGENGLSKGATWQLLVNAGDAGNRGLISGSERSPGGGHGNPLQYSCLEYPRERGAWREPGGQQYIGSPRVNYD